MKQHTPSWISGLNGLDLIARAHQLVQEGYKCASASSLTHFFVNTKRQFCVTKLHWLDGTWHIQTGTCLQTQWIQMIKLDCWSQYGYDLRSQLKVWWVHGFSNFHWGLLQTIATVVATSGPQTVGSNVFGPPTFHHRQIEKRQVASILDVDELGKREWPTQRCWWKTPVGALVKKQDIRWVNFFPEMSRFRIFQEVPASAAAVPEKGEGLVEMGWDLLVDLCVGFGRVPKCLVKILVWSSGTASAAGALLLVMPLPAEMGKEWVGRSAKHVICIHRHTSC